MFRLKFRPEILTTNGTQLQYLLPTEIKRSRRLTTRRDLVVTIFNKTQKQGKRSENREKRSGARQTRTPPSPPPPQLSGRTDLQANTPPPRHPSSSHSTLELIIIPRQGAGTGRASSTSALLYRALQTLQLLIALFTLIHCYINCDTTRASARIAILWTLASDLGSDTFTWTSVYHVRVDDSSPAEQLDLKLIEIITQQLTKPCSDDTPSSPTRRGGESGKSDRRGLSGELGQKIDYGNSSSRGEHTQAS
ncbi:hypothetical protein J6590_058354 [Homalodisca vitripennis]|nr:hypothetical protein J6590_058354 [Homalodisca vitripennis]